MRAFTHVGLQEEIGNLTKMASLQPGELLILLPDGAGAAEDRGSRPARRSAACVSLQIRDFYCLPGQGMAQSSGSPECQQCLFR